MDRGLHGGTYFRSQRHRAPQRADRSTRPGRDRGGRPTNGSRMSGILGIFGETGAASAPAVRQAMLAGLHERGRDRIWWQEISESAAIGAVAADWEAALKRGDSRLVVAVPPWTVAGDASLYYQADLRRALGADGSAPGEGAAADLSLLLAACRRWGSDCARHLEGDFAFLAYDQSEGTVHAARDFGGKRPLFYAVPGDTLLVASTLAALLAHPLCPRDLDLPAIAANAAGLFARADETPYRAIKRLPAGHTLTWRPGDSLRIRRHWEPPPMRLVKASPASFRSGTEELRGLLADAVAERLAPTGGTAVWMSGGHDSTAVFAIATANTRKVADQRPVVPVSIGYPPGDPGRENELIEEIGRFCDATVHWVDSAAVPMFERPREAAALRGEPFVHPYHQLNGALARQSRKAGARVALGGLGGDPLFQLSESYLSDLFRRGRWRALAAQWRRRRNREIRAFVRSVVLPTLPHELLHMLGRVRGRPLHASFARRPPDYLNQAFVRRHGLAERERLSVPARGWTSAAEYEMFWFFTYPFFPRIVSALYSVGFAEGVELRSPLCDQRIVRFAAARPLEERSWSGEKKKLLRAAVAGLLPDQILAPRPRKTGTSEGYFDTWIRHFFDSEFAGLFHDPLLAQLGIVDPRRLRDAWSRYFRSGSGELGAPLYFTLETELWLRGHVVRPVPGPG